MVGKGPERREGSNIMYHLIKSVSEVVKNKGVHTSRAEIGPHLVTILEIGERRIL